MTRSAGRWWGSPFLFAAIVTAVYATALTLARRPAFLDAAGHVAMGMTADMVVVVPAAYYLLLVRRRGLPIVTLLPVLVLSVLAASWIIPVDQQRPLRALELALAPLELALIVWIVWRATRAFGTAREDAAADALEQFRRAAFDILQNERAAEVFASEIAALYYALGSWRARPHVPPGASSHTQHSRSGHGAFLFGILILLLVEGFAVHLLLILWSPIAAWVFTITTAYAALWLIADYRATVLRPILVDDHALSIRAGLRCTLRVPRDRIVAISATPPPIAKERHNLTFLGTPTHWITLREPLQAQGPYGFRRRVRALGIKPDDPGAFERALESRLS